MVVKKEQNPWEGWESPTARREKSSPAGGRARAAKKQNRGQCGYAVSAGERGQAGAGKPGTVRY